MPPPQSRRWTIWPSRSTDRSCSTSRASGRRILPIRRCASRPGAGSPLPAPRGSFERGGAMTKNTAKARLREGGTAVGTMVSEMLTEEVAYVLAAAGFGFLVIDTEHGSADTETLQRISRGARSAGIVPLVRGPAIGSPFVALAL